MKKENSEEKKQKEKDLSEINLLERELQSLRENFDNEILVKNKLENKNKEYKLLLNSCLETFKKVKQKSNIKNNNNFYDFLISKLKDFFKEMSNKNEEIILSEK